MTRGRCATWPTAAPNSVDITCYGYKARIDVLRNEGVVARILVTVDQHTAEVLRAESRTMTPKAFAILASGIDQKKWENDHSSWKKVFKYKGKPLSKMLLEWEASTTPEVTLLTTV